MRVLLDCRMATWSGVGRYTTGLASALAARDDVELVLAVAGADGPALAPALKAEVITCSRHPLGFFGSFELARLIREMGADVVHCAHFPTPIPATTPVVVTLHDVAPLRVRGVMPSPAKRAVYRAWNARAAGVAVRLIVPSRWTAGEAEQCFRAARGKLTVIPEAADLFASGPVGPLEGSLAELVSAPYLLSMGNTKPHKDLRTLLGAFALLAASRPSLSLLLVGEKKPGYLDGAMAEAQAEVRARVSFTGSVTDAQLRALYTGAAVFVFPSRYEGFGLPPLEAMASGVPVICADAASLPEVVGSAGILFPAGDAVALSNALKQVIEDEALRRRLVRTGLERAASFSWERTGSETVAVYREAREAKRRGGRG
jgi:glycosyltransferase involved in cell wall biosynthesis